jgi:hypothetical protein
MFERLWFDALKSFHILYVLSIRKLGISSYEIESEFDITQKTCWKFRNKIQSVMKSCESYPLIGNVDVDEFLVVGSEQEKKGRSHGKKKLIIIALERMNLPAASGRDILMDFIFFISPQAAGNLPKEIKG